MYSLRARLSGWKVMPSEFLGNIFAWTDADQGVWNRRRKFKVAAPQHPFAIDLLNQSKAFDDAAAKFSIAA